MHIKLDDKVVWITGGGEGIGRAIAILAGKAGAKVAITGRDREPLAETVSSIEEAGGEAIEVLADVTRAAEMEDAVTQIIQRWKRIDVVVANAGTNGKWAPIEELTLEEWTKTIDVNLTGTFLTMHYAVPHLRDAGGGSIIIVSSVNGTRVFSNEGATAYAASKAAQLALGKMLALELARSKIRVNVICPGAIDTGIHNKTEKQDLERIETPVEYPEGSIPLTGGDMGRPEDVAQLVLFLASDAAAHITGSPIWIDGGESLVEG